MPRIVVVALLCLLFLPQAAAAAQPSYCTRAFVPEAALVGTGRMTFMVWDVYDAMLHAPRGKFSGDAPFSLTLTYRRDFDGRSIADTSVEEMRKGGLTDEVKLAEWHSRMRRIFPDVRAGDSLTGVRTENGASVFCSGGKEIGRIHDPDFGRHFFGIWLEPTTSAPQLRRALLGQR